MKGILLSLALMGAACAMASESMAQAVYCVDANGNQVPCNSAGSYRTTQRAGFFSRRQVTVSRPAAVARVPYSGYSTLGYASGGSNGSSGYASSGYGSQGGTPSYTVPAGYELTPVAAKASKSEVENDGEFGDASGCNCGPRLQEMEERLERLESRLSAAEFPSINDGASLDTKWKEKRAVASDEVEVEEDSTYAEFQEFRWKRLLDASQQKAIIAMN